MANNLPSLVPMKILRDFPSLHQADPRLMKWLCAFSLSSLGSNLHNSRPDSDSSAMRRLKAVVMYITPSTTSGVHSKDMLEVPAELSPFSRVWKIHATRSW